MVEWNKDLYGTSEKSPRDRKARILKSTFYSDFEKKKKEPSRLARILKGAFYSVFTFY
jgi:hypothetical protein